ncbi:MAG: flagellin lysine-N-methylase [Clostridia bacterium]|nr:flagellin lysine-N-methylase [Clostridia bacterium]
MKLYAPEYYKDFKCIADKCKHSCCIGWEIDIDSHTLDKYNKTNYGYGETIKNSIDSTETPHFKLLENEKCPHLNGKGLCNIILEYGDGYLCDICREHPRFYNITPHGTEVGIGMACEEACRFILESDNYSNIIEIADITNETIEFAEYDTLAQRSIIYNILADKSTSYNKRVKTIGDMYNVSLDDTDWNDVIDSLEYLNESHKDLFLNFSVKAVIPEEYEENAERALAYFLYRHCSEAETENDFRARLGFCLFCEKLLTSLASQVNNISKIEFYELARIISEELEYSENNTDAIKFEFCF